MKRASFKTWVFVCSSESAAAVLRRSEGRAAPSSSGGVCLTACAVGKLVSPTEVNLFAVSGQGVATDDGLV